MKSYHILDLCMCTELTVVQKSHVTQIEKERRRDGEMEGWRERESIIFALNDKLPEIKQADILYAYFFTSFKNANLCKKNKPTFGIYLKSNHVIEFSEENFST